VDLPRYHRLRSGYYRLEGQRCSSCDTVQFPARARCGSCGGDSLTDHRLSGRGEVYSYTEMTQAPDGFAPPHLMALVRLEEGLLLAAQLTDVEPDEIEIGMPVEMVTRRLREYGPRGFLVYGYKFRPHLERRPAS
jgi:uncharacterized OB-fold protein